MRKWRIYKKQWDWDDYLYSDLPWVVIDPSGFEVLRARDFDAVKSWFGIK